MIHLTASPKYIPHQTPAMYDLRDTQEQLELRDLFVRSYGRTMTTACPLCLPGHKGKSAYFFHRGRVTLPDGTQLTAMRCNNCNYIRTSKPRTPQAEGQTPAQARAILRINKLFSGYMLDKTAPLHKWDIKPDEHGGWWVTVETDGNVYIRSGAFIYVGKRGSVSVKSVYDLCSSREASEQRLAHYQYMLSK